MGTVVILHGTSSSGKTTLARAFQALMAEAGVAYLYMGLDDFWDRLPSRYGEDVPTLLVAAKGFHRCIRVLAEAGSNVILDTVLLRSEWKADLVKGLRSKQAFLVRVRCSLEELERRERARGDRRVGQARGQFFRVHRGLRYDLEVDTTAAASEACAMRIKRFLESGASPHALGRLAQEA